MNVETHLRNLRESLEVIRESIEKGLVERQRTLGFNTSAAAADMLELFLHSKNLIDPGFVIKHEWLKSIEKQLNISRSSQIVENLYGGDAAQLYRMWRGSGDDYYLKLLVEYNEEDVINLKRIAEHVCKGLREITLRNAKILKEAAKLTSV